ncbi:hypothetical protein T492DRAFT_882875, partial [Pavlovales sp. CCMP2436]
VYLDAEPAAGNVFLQCPSSHTRRVADYCARASFAVACSPLGVTQPPFSGTSVDKCVTLWCAEPALFALLAISDPVLSAVVQRVLLVPERAVTLDEALAGLVAELRRAKAGTVRCIAHPRSLADRLCASVEGAGVQLEPKRGRHQFVAALAWANSGFAYGLSRAVDSQPHEPATFRAAAATCRAYYKLREAISLEFKLPPAPAGAGALADGVAGVAAGEAHASPAPLVLHALRALDLGAAPGGWSSCLLEHGAESVVAIDPAEMAPE